MPADPPLRLALLLGDPVEHSLSPLIHNTAFRTVDYPAVYRAARTPPHALEAAVAGLRDPNVVGANITLPHKAAAVGLVDDLSAEAAVIGAINTIVRREVGTLVGYNTDVGGFLAPLTPAQFTGATVLVLGSGGAARAAVAGLLQATTLERLVIAARTPAHAEALVAGLAPLDVDSVTEIVALADAPDVALMADLIVNATPVGMQPDAAALPLPAEVFWEGQTVYDLVYAPRETRLLREASARGATVIGGLAMLVEQAAAAFRLWTGMEMPRAAVAEALGHG